ncbi:hypothetical protein QL285_063531 [Trifolium repens]|nr:hypothetical protein QL285_063531 [Trifolium repens]
MSKKRIHENLSKNNREKIQKVEKIVAKKLLIPSKSKKSEKPNLSLDTMISKTQCSKKEKRVPKCPSMLIGDYINLQKSKDMDGSKSNNGEKPGSNFHPSSSQPLKVSQNQSLAQVKETINEVETNKNREEDQGTSKRRTRGKTLMRQIHARTMEEREEMIFNEDGQPIGPTKKAVSGFSLFLGTLARNATFCPLIYKNWSKMPKKNKRRCWRYSQRKYILSAEARNWVVATVREAWRRYKYDTKRKHFSKYSNMTERLKHRPPKVPEAHFKNLCEYWNKEDIQAISEKNTRNRAQLKWVHRMGPQNFSLTREELRAKEGREPTQSEMFIETRKGNKGKQMDVETGKVISQLQEIAENEESDNDAFEAVFGKERPGRFRCLGRNITKTSLKRKSEINALKKAHSEEVSTLRNDFEGRIDRLQNAFKALMQHCNPQFNMESIEDLLGLSHGDAKESGPQMHSSTSTHAPDHGEQGINEDDEEDDGVSDEEDGGVSDDSQEDDESDDNGDISDEEDDEDDEFDKLK